MLKIKKYLPLILITVVALMLRLYQLDKSTWAQPSFDEARDMLVANHIVTHNEYVSRGPLAAGGMNSLQNSPVYYYFVAFIWFFTKEPTSFMYVWTIIMTLPVIIGYFIGKKLKDKSLGLILASFIAINYQMVFVSRELFQPNLLTLTSISYIWASISFLKSKRNKLQYLMLAIFFLLIPLHFHYGVLIILPVGMSWLIYLWLDINKNNHEITSHKLLAPIFAFLTLILSWILSSYRFVPFDQVNFLFSNFDTKYKSSFINQINEAYSIISQMTFGYNNPKIIVAMIFILLIGFGFEFNKKTLSFKKTTLFLLSMSLSTLFFGFYHHSIQAIYTLAIFPFFLVVTAVVIRTVIEKHKILGWIIVSLCFFTMFKQTKTEIFGNLPSISRKIQQEKIAKMIHEDYQNLTKNNLKTSQPKLLITTYNTRKDMPFNGWETSGIWYYLEQNFNQKLVKNTNYGVSHTPIERFPSTIYMVCEHRNHSELIQVDCLNSFERDYPTIHNETIKIGEILYFSIWSAKINPEITTRNVVNYELMND